MIKPECLPWSQNTWFSGSCKSSRMAAKNTSSRSPQTSLMSLLPQQWKNTHKTPQKNLSPSSMEASPLSPSNPPLQTAEPLSLLLLVGSLPKSTQQKLCPKKKISLSTQSNQTKAPPPPKGFCHLPLLGDIPFLSRICPSDHPCSHTQHHYTLQPSLIRSFQLALTASRFSHNHLYRCQPLIAPPSPLFDSLAASQNVTCGFPQMVTPG